VRPLEKSLVAPANTSSAGGRITVAADILTGPSKFLRISHNMLQTTDHEQALATFAIAHFSVNYRREPLVPPDFTRVRTLTPSALDLWNLALCIAGGLHDRLRIPLPRPLADCAQVYPEVNRAKRAVYDRRATESLPLDLRLNLL